METEIIYTATANHIKDSKWRCWAWFGSLEEAQKAVENCGEFLQDKYYSHLVIEKIPRGAISQKYNEWWYEWKGNEWIGVDKPKEVENMFHFGIG